MVATATLAGCGGYGYVEAYDEGYGYPDPVPYAYGSVEVDNLTDTSTFEYVLSFYLALSGTGAFSGNLLSAPLPPGTIEYVGEWLSDTYDAEADLEFGDLVQWFDVPVPAGDVTTFEVF
jgi:hypothetical protein